MDFYPIQRISFQNAQGSTTVVELLRYQSSAESDPLPKLQIVEGDKIEWSFSNDWGEGVLQRYFKCVFRVSNSNNIDEIIQSAGKGNIRLRIKVGDYEMFEGAPESLSTNQPYDIRNMNMFPVFQIRNYTSDYRFVEPVSLQKSANINLIRRAVKDSLNSVHDITHVPVSDLISEFIFEKAARFKRDLFTANSWHAQYQFEGAKIAERWLHRACLNLSLYESDTTIEDLLFGLSTFFSLRIGWSFKKEAICIIESTVLATGTEPAFDDGLYAQQSFNPHYLAKVSDGYRDEIDDNIQVELFDYGGAGSGPDKPLITPAKRLFHSPWMGVQLSSNSDDPGRLQAERYYNNEDATDQFHVERRQDLNFFFSDGSFIEDNMPTIVPYNWFVRPFWRVSSSFNTVAFASCINYGYLRFFPGHRIGINIEVPKLIDPMLPIRLIEPHALGSVIHRAIKGAWNIKRVTTEIETFRIGQYSQSYLSDNSVPFSQWIYNDL